MRCINGILRAYNVQPASSAVFFVLTSEPPPPIPLELRACGSISGALVSPRGVYDRPQRDSQVLQNVRREVALMKKLVHPNVVRLLEVIDDPQNDLLFMVSESTTD